MRRHHDVRLSRQQHQRPLLRHDRGRVALLTATTSDDSRLVEELYLTFFSRFPSDDERRVAAGYLRAAPARRGAAEDLAWSMLNSLEFVFNH